MENTVATEKIFSTKQCQRQVVTVIVVAVVIVAVKVAQQPITATVAVDWA